MRKKLDDIVTLFSGNAWKADLFKKIGEMPIIRIQNMGENKTRNFIYWNEKYDKSFIVRKGDLLLSLSGSIKLDFWDGEPALLNQRIVKIIPKSGINTQWLFFQLKNHVKSIERMGNLALVNNVSLTDLRKLNLNVPSHRDQLHIAYVLSRAENLISQRQKSIRLLDEFLKSTFWEMFGGDFDKQIVKLETVASITSGLTKGKKYDGKQTKFAPYMRVANVQDGYLDLVVIKKIEATEDEIQRYNLCYGDLLLTEGGDPDKLGRGSIWKNEVENCIFQNHIFRVRAKSDKINPFFLSFLTGSNYGKKYFLKSAKQTTGIASINSTQLKSFPVIVSPLPLQIKFAQIVEKTENLKKQYKKSLQELEILYNSLSQRAFKGELNAKDEEMLTAAEPQEVYITT